MINFRTASQFHRTLRMKLKKSLKESLNTASTIIILLFFNLLILRVVVAQSCLTLCVPMDCSLQGSSVLGIFQARVLEWVAIFFSRRSPQPRDQTQVCLIAGRCFTVWATREATILRVAGTLTINCCSFSQGSLKDFCTNFQRMDILRGLVQWGAKASGRQFSFIQDRVGGTKHPQTSLES